MLTDTPEQTLWCLDQARAAMVWQGDWAQLLGVHLEGPFLASEYKGAMPEHLLQKGNAELFRRYAKAAEGSIKYMTVSPEVEGVPEMIRQIAGYMLHTNIIDAGSSKHLLRRISPRHSRVITDSGIFGKSGLHLCRSSQTDDQPDQN